jgi:chitodextrinase
MKFLSALAIAASVITGYTADNVPASANPPSGLSANQVPQFVSFGFDDNGYSGLPESGSDGAMTWSTNFFKNLNNPAGTGNPATFDGQPVRASYFMTSYYISTQGSESPVYVKRSWRTALVDGHEIGNHTQTHADGLNFSSAQWLAEIDPCNSWLTKPYSATESPASPDATKGIGMTTAKIQGFRSPYLHYNDALMSALRQRGFLYDVSIEDGFQPTVTGRTMLWPYTLDNGSPGNNYLQAQGLKGPIGSHPGLWELPAYPVIVPPDAALAQYGLSTSLRSKVKANIPHFDVSTGKLTGLDYTMWVEAKMTKAEFVATLKYTLDERLAGNRAPFLYGAHTDYYSPKYGATTSATVAERRAALEEFVQYALSKSEVRFRPFRDVITWMKSPVALDPNAKPRYTVSASVQGETQTSGSCSDAAWNSATAYSGGAKVSYNNKTWRAKWWTQNNAPGSDPVWEDLGSCASVTTVYNGTVSPASALVEQGQNHTVTITPNSGYKVKNLIIDGVTTAAATSYTFNNVQGARNLVAVFEPGSGNTVTYTINASATTGGSISPSGATTVNQGANQTFNWTANSGYRVDSVKVNGAKVTATNTYTFNSVAANGSIQVFFGLIPVQTVTLTVNASTGGTTTPSGTVTLNKGSNQTIQFTPSAGYGIQSVLVNGTSVGRVSSYTVSNIQANTTVAAQFAPLYTVTATAGTGGTVSPASQNILSGDNGTVSISANSGYTVKDVTVNGASVGKVTTYAFNNVSANQTLAATFETVVTGNCNGHPLWNSLSIYNTGNRVQHQGIIYRAQWWTQNNNPSTSGQWGVWVNEGACP